MSIFNAIMDFLFPAKCFLCGSNSAPLCCSCAHTFPMAERPTYEWVFPLFDYRHKDVKQAIWHLKYRKKKELAQTLGTLLYESILEELDDLEKLHNVSNPLFISIPMHGKKKRSRGFNQSEAILNVVIEKSKKEWEKETSALKKIKDTGVQARIRDRKDRLQNMKGAFAVNHSGKIYGRDIILIDDVITTGATLSEAKKVLESAGAKKVFAFTLAH